ncbi:MAG: excinuclease ABC subunit UvrC [Desulfovibrio sp.]|nr:excinuclease ABC subunit UvrC [Desulfovibrio sp.]
MKRPDPSEIPLSPGVYIYKDAKGRIIYVGKARILRRRVLSYFRPNGLSPKTVALMNRAESIEYIATNTEKEALLLEGSLIKKHRPHYNIVLRDDKNYFLFRLNLKDDFPRLEFTRRVKKDGAKYFGPFTSALAARETWKLAHRAFALRRCANRAMKNRVRPCLYYHMGQCPAPCMGEISKSEYRKTVQKVNDLLSGKSGELLKGMTDAMNEASENLEFEKAALLRDQIKAVERTVEKQAAIIPGAGDLDAIGLYQGEKGLSLGIVFVRNGAVGDGRAFYWPGLGFEDSREVVMSFLNQFYGVAAPPPRIIVPWQPSDEDDPDYEDDKKALEQIFSEKRGGSVKILAPRDDADNRLVDLAQANAREHAKRRSGQDINAILEKLESILQLKEFPARIECADVSHISGTQTRVGMVVYEDGAPDKSAYRLYSMPDSSDDYGTLYLWIGRRLESGPPWPDLLLIDGGRGQLASVEKGLRDNGKAELFPIASIAKARDEAGRADRRAGNISDRIFLPGRSNPLPLKPGSPELLFLQQIRDAAHRFSIEGHRKARRSAAFSSELMRLPGIGTATARLLWDKFGDIDSMRKATLEELMTIPGIGKAKGAMIIEKLRSMAKE